MVELVRVEIEIGMGARLNDMIRWWDGDTRARLLMLTACSSAACDGKGRKLRCHVPCSETCVLCMWYALHCVVV